MLLGPSLEFSSSTGLQGQQDGEAGAPGLAFELDHALMLGNEVLREREPQASAAFAPRDQGKKNLVADFFRHSGAVIDDLNDHAEAVQLARQGDLPRDARAQYELPIPVEGLRRVAADVEQRLDNLFFVCLLWSVS